MRRSGPSKKLRKYEGLVAEENSREDGPMGGRWGEVAAIATPTLL